MPSTPNISQLNRMLVNFHRAVFERGAGSANRNRPVRLIVNQQDTAGITESLLTTFAVPKLRAYEDMSLTGDYDPVTGFPVGSSEDYMEYTVNVFDDPANTLCGIFRFRPQFASFDSAHDYPIIFELSSGTSTPWDRIVAFYEKGSNRWYFGREATGSGAIVAFRSVFFAADDELTFGFRITPTTVGVALAHGGSVQGFNSVANGTIPTLTMDTFSLGGTPTGGQANSQCAFDFVIFGNGTISDDYFEDFATIDVDDLSSWMDLPDEGFAEMDPCFFWLGEDETHVHTPIGESYVAS